MDQIYRFNLCDILLIIVYLTFTKLLTTKYDVQIGLQQLAHSKLD